MAYFITASPDRNVTAIKYTKRSLIAKSVARPRSLSYLTQDWFHRQEQSACCADQRGRLLANLARSLPFWWRATIACSEGPSLKHGLLLQTKNAGMFIVRSTYSIPLRTHAASVREWARYTVYSTHRRGSTVSCLSFPGRYLYSVGELRIACNLL